MRSKQPHEVALGVRVIAAWRELEGQRHAALQQPAKPADDLRLVALGVDPDEPELLRRRRYFAQRFVETDHGNRDPLDSIVGRWRSDRVRSLVARMKVQRGSSGGLARCLRNDRDCVREPVRLDIHGEQPRVLRLRLERDRASKASGAQRVDRVGADIGADIDEHGAGRKPAIRRQHGHGLIDLAPLPAAVPHGPCSYHAVGGIDEEARIAKIAEHEVAARSERVHDGVAQHRTADQQRLEHPLPQRAAAAAVGSFDLAPRRHSRRFHLAASASRRTRDAIYHTSSVPIPKFAPLCGTLVCELRNRRTLATY